MGSVLNEWLSLPALIWLLPVVFALHDGEEIMTVERWVRAGSASSRKIAETRLLDTSKRITIQFIVAVFFLGVFLCILSYVASIEWKSGSKPNVLFVGALTVLLIDGIKHVGISATLRTYTPGVVTAALIEIPYSAYALHRFYAAGAIDGPDMAWGTVIVLPLTIVLVLAGLTLGKAVAPYTKIS